MCYEEIQKLFGLSIGSNQEANCKLSSTTSMIFKCLATKTNDMVHYLNYFL